MALRRLDRLRSPYKDESPVNINVSDTEPDRNAVRLERQIARVNQALASAEAGYYVTDDELDKNPEASWIRRASFRRNWV